MCAGQTVGVKAEVIKDHQAARKRVASMKTHPIIAAVNAIKSCEGLMPDAGFAHEGQFIRVAMLKPMGGHAFVMEFWDNAQPAYCVTMVKAACKADAKYK